MTDEKETPAPRAQLYAALAKATSEFPTIIKDREVIVQKKSGGTYRFKYAQLETILSAVRKPLSDNELVLVQRVVRVNELEYIETLLAHGSGETISNLIRMIVLDTGPQAYGSAQMYARRQGVTLLLCIAAEDDDDANEAEGNEVRQVSRQVEGEDGVPDMAGKAATLPVDPEMVAEYAKRIIAALDNQDPKGAALLYRELNDDEKIRLWKTGGLTMKQKDIIRQALKGAA